jgi:hypothetical protein
VVKWTVAQTTTLHRNDQKKLSVEQLRKYGLWLVPTVLHARNEQGVERHILSVKEYATGDIVEAAEYVLIAQDGLVAKTDSSGNLSLSVSEGLPRATFSEFRGQAGHLEFAVVAPDVWQPIAAHNEKVTRFANAIAEVAIARHENPEMTMADAVKQAKNLIEKGGH